MRTVSVTRPVATRAAVGGSIALVLIAGLALPGLAWPEQRMEGGLPQASATLAALEPAAAASFVPSALAPGASTTAAGWRMHEGQAYKRDWGVEIDGIHTTASGYMLSFRYRVLDPERAQVLNNAKSKAFVIDELSGARLAVPAMENVGELRQTTAPLRDRSYFVVFGNPGQLVHKGGRVSVVIGGFTAKNLIVE